MKIYIQDPKLQRKYVYQGQALPGINFFVKIDYQFNFHYFYEFAKDSNETSSHKKNVKA